MTERRSKLTALFWVRDSLLPTIKAPLSYKATLLLSASYANPDGSRIFQSSRSIAALLGCERSTVQDALKFWRQLGFLVLVKSGNGRGHANEYRIDLERECTSPPLEANGVTETPFEHVNGVTETPFSVGNGVIGSNKRGGKRGAYATTTESPNKSTEKRKKALATLACVAARRDHVLEEFSEETYLTLLAFEEHRKKLRAPMSERALELILKKLARFRAEGMDPIEVLEQSIMNGWVGIFPTRRERGSHERGKPTATELAIQNAKALGLDRGAD